MRVLAIAAHPDDIELGCAGTLAKYAAAGHSVVITHLCNGALGGKIAKEELARLRQQEANNAARVIGAEYLPPLYEDLSLYPDKAAREAVAKIICHARPDLIITHPPNDYAPDHNITSQLVFDASFLATLPNFAAENGIEAHQMLTPVFYMDSVLGLDFEPTYWIDISDTFELKQRMLECHESQVKWLKEWRNSDLVAHMQAQARYRGMQCGVEYAEVFRSLTVARRVRALQTLPIE